jgi:hypothetical protein
MNEYALPSLAGRPPQSALDAISRARPTKGDDGSVRDFIALSARRGLAPKSGHSILASIGRGAVSLPRTQPVPAAHTAQESLPTAGTVGQRNVNSVEKGGQDGLGIARGEA